jgi:hypothetical protein
MKSEKQQPDIDYIGGGGPLTKDEEKAISEFISSGKTKPTKKRAAQHGLAKSGSRSKKKVLKTRAAFGKP